MKIVRNLITTIMLALLAATAPVQAYQASINVPNGTGAAVRSNLNNALQAITTQQSASTAPSVMYAYQIWADTSTTPITIRMRNGGNTAWVVIGTLDNSANTFLATNADKVDGSHASAFATAAQGTKADAALPSASYTATDVLTKIKTVDGTGSGLDADYLQGNPPGTYIAIAAPPGTVTAFAASTVPSGWKECNGAAISRVTYANLFNVIGTTWGAGDGSTTFNLPDLRGEFIRGWDHGKGTDSGRTFASSQTDAFQGHYHNIGVSADNDFVGYTTGGGGPGYAAGYGGSTPKARTPITDGTNGTPRTGAETRPRNIALMYIIKY